MQGVLLRLKEEKSVCVLEEKPGSGLFPTLFYSYHQLIKFNRKEKIKSLFIIGRLTRVWGIWGELAELSTERKIKLSKLDMEISKASSPISTNIIHVILCLLRKGIYLPPERCPGSWVKGPTLNGTIPHTQRPKAQRITAKTHLLASFQQTPQITHPQTSPFPENKCQQQCKEQLQVFSCPGEHAAVKSHSSPAPSKWSGCTVFPNIAEPALAMEKSI